MLLDLNKKNKKGVKISLKIITPVVIICLVILGLISYVEYNQGKQDLKEDLSNKVSLAQKYFKKLEARDIKVISTILQTLAKNENIQEMYLEQNRDKLFEYCQTIFEENKKTYGITHWYFIGLDGTSFLRMHDRNNYGDSINRKTFANAKETNSIASGLELGKTAFALRVVTPYYHNGELIGYMELGQEIDHFLIDLANDSGDSFAIAVDKSGLSRDEWKRIRSFQKLADNWDDYGQYLIISRSHNENSLHEYAIKEFLTQNYFEHDHANSEKMVLGTYEKNQKITNVGVFNIIDAGGKKTGLVYVSTDVTDIIAEKNKKLFLLISLFFLIVISFLFILLWIIKKNILKPILLINNAMKRTGKDLEISKVELRSRDELGEIAAVYNNMLDKLITSRTAIEKEVKEKTADIIQKSEQMEKQQKAILNILEDVEDEKKHADDLAKDLEKFKLAVDNTSNHIVITDKDGITLYANHAVENITGFSIQETMGKKAGSKELWGGLMEKKVYEEMWKTIKTDKQTFIGEVNNRRKNGENYIALANISPVLNKKGHVEFFVGIERDITKEKEVDRAKTEFVSLASHQLRTPLTAIGWYTEMLLAGDIGKLNKKQKSTLSNIYSSNKRMVDLVKALLNVSRIDLGTFAIDPQLSDITKIARSVIEEIKPSIEFKKIKFTAEIDKKIPPMMLDPNLVRIIFQNLLSNSVKYTQEKGKVKLNLVKVDDSIKITVTDNGCGIPKDQQPRIFNKLFRADNARLKVTDGTGLGLYVLKSIVDNSGGRVWFESEVDKGTTFYVTLPLAGMQKKAGAKGLSAIG